MKIGPQLFEYRNLVNRQTDKQTKLKTLLLTFGEGNNDNTKRKTTKLFRSYTNRMQISTAFDVI